MRIKHLGNARDGTLIFFSCDSTNRLGGSGASSLAALGVGWEEQHLQFYFPDNGDRFLTKFIYFFSLGNYSLKVDYKS